MKKCVKKIQKNKGETLVETFVALLIAALAMLLLPGAIVASAKMNATVAKQTTYAEDDNKDDTFSQEIAITFGSGTSHTMEVTRYGSENSGLYEITEKP